MSTKDDWNRNHSRIAVLFVLAQIGLCFLLDAAEQGRIIASCIVVMSSLLAVQNKKRKMSNLVHSLLLTLTAALFALHAMARFFSAGGIDVYELFELLASFLLIVQAFELLRERSTEMYDCWRNNYLPGLGTLVLVLLFVGTDVSFSVTTIERLFLATTLLLAFAMRPDFISMVFNERLRSKAISLAAIVGVTMVAALLFQEEVVRQIPQLQEVLRKVQSPIEERERFASEPKARMVDRVDLSSISKAQQIDSEKMVFKVESDDAPGYMRTLSFEQFDGTSWFNVWERDRSTQRPRARRIAPLINIPSELNLSGKSFEFELFPLGNPISKDSKELLVTIPANHGLFVPLPQNATHILAQPGGRVRQLLTDFHGNVWPNSIRNDQYRVFVGAQAVWPSEDDYLDRLLEIPPTDATFIKGYSFDVCKQSGNVRLITQQIAKFFNENFTYSFEVDAIGTLDGRSSLRAFMENQKAGHCEYFATATVLMLRALGVPSRLSTGYVVYERDDAEGYYFARNRDAHAWAEAFDRATGEWIIVESTPGMNSLLERVNRGVDDAAIAETFNSDDRPSLTVSLWQLVQPAWNWFYRLGALRFSWLLPVALAGCWLAYYLFARHRQHQADHRYISKQVQRADRLAAKLGFERAHHETCQQFAHRLLQSPAPKLNELGKWYLDYSQKRYRNA